METSFQYKQKMLIKQPLNKVFAFFSDAQNLQMITPPQLNFQILSKTPIEMKENALIYYKLKIFGVPFKWRSKIINWSPPLSFTDCQEKGPYRSWIHNHFFEETPQGVIMTDNITYSLSPLIPAKWINKWFVYPEITKIFQYRYKVLDQLFHTPS